VIRQLEALYRLDDATLPLDLKSEFFAASYQTYGRSALVLHGTVAFGLSFFFSLFFSFLFPF